MRLTKHTDYSFRVLIFLALRGEKTSTIKEISERYQISTNHLMKVVNRLVQEGFVHSKRGRSGGIRLASPPEEINLGEVLERLEGETPLVECMDAEGKNCCLISPSCKLKGMLRLATRAFMDTLKKYTLADLMTNRGKLSSLLDMDES